MGDGSPWSPAQETANHLSGHNRRRMPAGIDFVRGASDDRIRIVSREVSSWELRGSVHPVSSRSDEGSEGTDISEHL